MSEEHIEKSGCLTFFQWGLPFVIVPIIQAIFMQAWQVGAAINICILAGFGWWWAGGFGMLTANRTGSAAVWGWLKVILYVILQSIIIPLVYYGIYYGACMTGSRIN